MKDLKTYLGVLFTAMLTLRGLSSAPAAEKMLVDFLLPVPPQGALDGPFTLPGQVKMDPHRYNPVLAAYEEGKGQNEANDNRGSKIGAVPFDGEAFGGNMQQIVAAEQSKSSEGRLPRNSGQPCPASDPANTGSWILNQEISDEFEGRALDASKWLVQGTAGEYRSQFVGRAPSQFSTRNVRVEDGKLKLQTRWEPDFPFSDKPDEEGRKYENITTAAVISKRQFLHGYMEIKCKAADASVTSSFWATGRNSELDVFEFMGAPSQAHKKHLEKEYMFTMIDWSKRPSSIVWRGTHQLNWRVADDFHVYGCAWNADCLKFYADGELIDSVTRKEIGDRWILNYPLWIWVDSETFPWHGLPQKKDLPADFEIEYIRVWQQKEFQ